MSAKVVGGAAALIGLLLVLVNAIDVYLLLAHPEAGGATQGVLPFRVIMLVGGGVLMFFGLRRLRSSAA